MHTFYVCVCSSNTLWDWSSRNRDVLFAIFSVPGITTRALKKKEREAGKCIEDIAGNSCLKAVELEKSMTERFIFKTHV